MYINNCSTLIFVFLFLFPPFANADIYIAYLTPMGEDKLLHSKRCDDVNPVWSPDGSLVAFERIERGWRGGQGINYFELGEYVIRPIAKISGKGFIFRTERETPYLEEDSFYAGYFAWAPDGSKRFIYTEGSSLYLCKIDVKKVSDRGVYRKEYEVKRRLFLKLDKEDGNFIANKYCDWSILDKVVFVSGVTGNGDIYVLRIKDAARKEKMVRLTKNPHLDTTPKFLPNGRSVVYSAFEDGNMNIRLISNIEAGEKAFSNVSLTNWPTEELNPTCSPDSKKIAFYVLKKAEEKSYDLWVMDRTGSNKKKVASQVLRQWKKGPSWLPARRGRKLIYISEHGDRMYIVDVDTMERWIVKTAERVMSDVSCAEFNGNLFIAYSAQAPIGRKRIYVRALKLTKKPLFVVQVAHIGIVKRPLKW